jgi:hypothetical protein
MILDIGLTLAHALDRFPLPRIASGFGRMIGKPDCFGARRRR